MMNSAIIKPLQISWYLILMLIISFTMSDKYAQILLANRDTLKF